MEYCTADWGSLVDVVGFCFLNLAKNYKPPEDLSNFLKAGPAPIYIGFGSLVSKFIPPTKNLGKLLDGLYLGALEVINVELSV